MTLLLGIAVAISLWSNDLLIAFYLVFGYPLIRAGALSWFECFHGKHFRELTDDFENNSGFAGVIQRLWILMSAIVFAGVLLWGVHGSGLLN